jgi:hypothetical protein
MAAVRIGSTVKGEAVEGFAAGIDKIFTSAFNNRIDQDTVRVALEQLGRLGTVHASVSDCTIHSGVIGR